MNMRIVGLWLALQLLALHVLAADKLTGTMVPVMDLILDEEAEPDPPVDPPPPEAFQTIVILVADESVSPRSNELVTFGLPFAENELTDLAQIQVSSDGFELPICIEQTMTWWGSNSIRAVKIQLRNVDMRVGNKEILITDTGRDTGRDLSCLPVTNGWKAAGSTKSNELHPRIFALHDMEYLATTRLIPPYQPAPETPDAFENYVVKQVTDWSGALNYDASRHANWLFDRSTAYFKNYMTTGRVDLLKEAVLSKQYYFQFVRNDNVDPRPQGGSGCWTKPTTACADGKYIAPQQAKLALALVGDDSQWDHELLIKMAQQADLGWNQYGCSRPAPTDQNFGFTERGCGLVGLAQLSVYEVTGDSGVLATMNEIIDYLKAIQQTEFSWDTNNGWTPKSGAFTHDIEVHEGHESVSSAPENYTDGQGFSPWMSENSADFLWQAYWVTGDTDLPEMLRRLGNAIDLYAFTSVYNASNGKHDTLDIFSGDNRASDCNTESADTELLYFGSAYASGNQRASHGWWRGATDQHNIEVVLPLAAAYYFETNNANKTRLSARINKMIDGMVNDECAEVSGPWRLFNWQHRSNSVRTWFWVEDQ